MKILVLHIPNTYNYGSMMMAENLITYLNKISNKKIQYYLDVEDEKNLNRMKDATKYNEIYQYQKPKINYSGNKITRNIKKIIEERNEIKRTEREYDKIIYLGGDDFSEFYIEGKIARIMTCFDLLNLKLQNKSGKVVLLGQTIGPYTGILKKVARYVFPKIKIYTRDKIYIQEMKKQYNINAIPSKDLAFLDLALQNEYISKKDDILTKYQLEENKYIVIVGTEFLKQYCEEKIFLKKFKEMILIIKQNYPTKKLVWLSHVTSKPPRSSDNYLLDLLNKKYDNIINKNMTVIKEDILPVEARIILGSSYCTVTCRMHAAVSTFQMNKPAICLSYSPKYKGVIADGIDMKELVIEAKGNKFWKDKMPQEIIAKLKYIEENNTNLQETIKQKVTENKEEVMETLKKIVGDEVQNVENSKYNQKYDL